MWAYSFGLCSRSLDRLLSANCRQKLRPKPSLSQPSVAPSNCEQKWRTATPRALFPIGLLAIMEPSRRAAPITSMGILRPGGNCWRIEPVSRAAVLVDAAAYFSALRDALRQARHSVFIVGWDLDSRTKLAGENCTADDGWPLTLR